MAWIVEALSETVGAELTGLRADMRARLARIAELIELVGLPNVKEPHVRHIRGPIWGDPPQGKSRHCPSAIYRRQRAARCHPASLREEDREDPRS